MFGKYPYLARQGWPFILAAVVAALTLQIFVGYLWALPLWVVAALVVFLCRDPERKIPSSPLGVVSPVDGHVTAIESCRDHYLERNAIKVSLRMRFLGAYTIRSPIEGKIMKMWLLTRGSDKAPPEVSAAETDRYAIWVQTDEKDDVVFAAKIRPWAMQPRYYVHIGQRIGQGQRCGMVSFGCDMNVYLPENSGVHVQVGGKVVAGSDLIATLVHGDIEVSPNRVEEYG